MSAIHNAVIRGDLSEIKLRAADDPVVLNETDDWGLAPLHYAAVTRQSDVAELLVQLGADPNRKSVAVDGHYYNPARILRLAYGGVGDTRRT